MSGDASDSLTDLLKEAVQHLNGGRWPDARSRLEQILCSDPSHAVALYLLGVGEFRQGIGAKPRTCSGGCSRRIRRRLR